MKQLFEIVIYIVLFLGFLPKGISAPLNKKPEVLYLPAENGVSIEGPEFSWGYDFHKEFQVNQRQYNLEKFDAKVRTIATKDFSSAYNYRSVIVLDWPENALDPSGDIEVELYDRQDQSFFKTTIQPKQFDLWSSNKILQELSEKGESSRTHILTFESQVDLLRYKVGIALSDNSALIKNARQGFSYCLRQNYEHDYLEWCFTKRFQDGLKKRMVRKISTAIDREYKVSPAQGKFLLKLNSPFEFHYIAEDHFSLQIKSFVPKLEIVDVVDFEGVPRVTFRCLCPWEQKPESTVEKIKQVVGFDSSIKPEFFYFYTSAFRSENSFNASFKMYPSKNFLYSLKFEKPLLNIKYRPTLVRSYPSTYSSKLTYRLIESENEISFDSLNLQKAKVNLSKIEFRGHKFGIETYRSYSTEFSGRFSAVVSDGSALIMQELAFQHWFESLLGWKNNIFSLQRWGFSYKNYVTNVSLGAKDDDEANFSIKVSQLDLKYRFSPGVWAYDESWGAVLSRQAYSIGESDIEFVGAGVFWARSMPKVFDGLLNYIPWFRYPKWVDFEFIYYPLSLTDQIRSDLTFNLNFHGKILWTERFFGEAGFGLKRYGFGGDDVSSKSNFFYATVGVGVNF